MDFAGGAPGRPRHPQLKCRRYFGSRFQTDAVLQPKKKANLWLKTSMMNSWEKSAKLPGIFRKTSHKCHYPAVCDDCPPGRHFSSSSRWHGLPHRPPPREWGLRGFGDRFQVVKGQVVFTTALNIRQLWTFETHCHSSGDLTRVSCATDPVTDPCAVGRHQQDLGDVLCLQITWLPPFPPAKFLLILARCHLIHSCFVSLEILPWQQLVK